MFKLDFKYYKSRNPPPDLKDVVNFNNDIPSHSKKVFSIQNEYNQSILLTMGLQPPISWTVFELESNPGLICIRNPFTPSGQRYWVTRCLKDYTKKPNKLNIDAHNTISKEQDWWETCKHSDNKNFRNSLRWATLGYHHNWDTKEYSEEEKDVFPADLAELCNFIAKCLNIGSFKAEAAIVNFYHMDSTLSGHTDHSEPNCKAPLFSFSFGQSAIFLIGGETVDVKPTPLLLQSGDIVVMRGLSRLCYHGVPRILSAPSHPWNESYQKPLDRNPEKIVEGNVIEDHLSKCEWLPFNSYIETSRININVRQVLMNGQNRL